MSEALTCPECSRQLRLPRGVVGREVRCPMCQAAFFARDAGGGRAEPVSSPDAVRPLRPPMMEEDVPVRPPREPEVSTRGRLVRVVGGLVLAAGIPLLAVGFGGVIGGTVGAILWSMLAFVLAGLGAIGEVTRPERRLFRGVGPRTVWASVLFVGYLALVCAFWFDRHPVPPGDWQTFRPPEGGYRVEMPGRPAAVAWQRSRKARIYRVRHARSGMTFEVGEFEVQPRHLADSAFERLNQGLDAVQRQHPAHPSATVWTRDESRSEFGWGGVRQHEYQRADGRYVVVRLQVKPERQGQRLFVLVVTAPFHLDSDTAEVRRFFRSAQLEAAKDEGAWP